MSKITSKKSLIILVACLICVMLVLTACVKTVPFTPAGDALTGGAVEGNGGIAVKYNDYIYYVNGHQGNASTDNAYTNDIRTGSIVRISVAKLDEIISINEGSEKDVADRVATAVKGAVELVVPCFYYSANTTNTSLNGIYIFNDRIYITTPNQDLTAGGNTQFDQLVLRSYKLNGADEQQHATFNSNSMQIMLSCVNNVVHATYLDGSTLRDVNVATGVDSEIVTEISGTTFDGKNNAVYYINKDGAICKFVVGSESKTLVANVEDITYTISSISDGYVYYTKADANNSTMDGKIIYCANETVSDKVVLNVQPSTAFIGWGEKVISTEEKTLGETSAKKYVVKAFWTDGTATEEVLFESRNAITLVKVEGNLLYYTEKGISYTRNLADGTTVAYAKDLSTTAQGWAVPDVLGNYTFALTSSSTVTVVKFDSTKLTNTKAANITLVAETEDAE